MRSYGAVLIAFCVGVAVAAVLVAVVRVIRPGSDLVTRDRVPAWWTDLTAWARSRSLRLWCPEPRTAALVAAHLQTEGGRRLTRLGASIANGPWEADVLIVERADLALLDAARAAAPVPVATVVLAEAGDAVEFRAALVELAAAHRLRNEGERR